jgi:hypothetical protein
LIFNQVLLGNIGWGLGAELTFKRFTPMMVESPYAQEVVRDEMSKAGIKLAD